MARYWLPHKEHVWIPGTLVSTSSDKATFSIHGDDDGEIMQLPVQDVAGFATVDAEQEAGVEDICQLAAVTEGILLHTTRVRYGKKLIYTRVSRTLLAMNPFDDLPIYSSQYVEQYKALADSMDAPPHIFGVSQDALKGLGATDNDQAILISGESGAGKTESAKLILSFVADAVRGTEGGIEERVLQTNPVLEAFGNAMTVRNNNSSRFGKWLDLRFSGGGALAVMGCSLTSYLLETMRVCSQAADERGFHVFYQMLQVRSSPVLSHLGLDTPLHYNYLKDAQLQAPGIDDAEGFVELREAFFMLGIDEQMQAEIFRVLAAILVLGNCDFCQEGHDASRLADEAPARQVAEHLKVSPEKVIRCLLFRQIAIGRDITEAALRVDQARAARDGLARLLYGRLFLWLLSRLNSTLTLDDCPPAGEERLMGILDIAGFESFTVNSLEQLMINLSNEHLQQYFNKVVFKEELEESAREGIQMEGKIEFADNADCLSLIDGKAGLLDLLDETMVVPKVTDMTYVTKVLKQHDKHPRIIAPKFAKLGFGIRHFAGNVQYTCEGWLEKNADRPPDESAQLLVSSELELLVEIGATMADERAALEAGGGGPPASRGPGPSQVSRGPAGRGKKTRSVTAGFRTSLRSLISKIQAADPHYIRCVKPNAQKVPGRFTSAMVMEQMLLSGVLSTVHIRQQGFAYRILHKQFVLSYRCIADSDTNKRLPKSDINAQIAQNVCETLRERMPGLGPKAFAVGKSKVFMKQAAFKTLEDERRRVLGSMSIFIQRVYRGVMARNAIVEMKELRGDLRALLGRMEMAPDAAGRRSSSWTGVSIYEQFGALDEMQMALAELSGLLDRAQSLGFRNGDTVDAEYAKRRMLLEVDAVAELQKLHTSVDPVAMEKAMARARSVKLLSTNAAMELEIRLVRVRAQLPLMKAMEAAIAESAKKGEEDLREIIEGAEELGLQKGSDKWLPELGGPKLLEEVEAILEEKVAARKLEEQREAERLAAEKAAEEARRLEAERLAAEAAAKAAEEEAKQRALEAEEAAKAEAARLEAARAEAAKAEAAALEAAKADAGQIEAAKAEAAKAEALAADAAKAEAQASETVKAESVKTEAAKAEALKAEEARSLACQQEPEEAIVDENGEPNGLLRRSVRRKTTRKRTCVTGLAEADCSQTMSALKRAVDEYDAEALEELLRRVAENGIKEEDGSSRGIEAARGVFERLQDQEFVLETLSEVKEAATEPDPPIGVLKRLEHLARQLRKLPGYEAEADEANATLQAALVDRSGHSGQNSMFDSKNAQELELAKRIYGNLQSYSRLKPEKEWTGHTPAAGSIARRPSLAFCKVKSLSAGGGKEGEMLMHSKACIFESLTRVPEGQDHEEYEGSAVMNFRNVLLCMGDRPAQHCQRNASRAAIIYLALSDALLREEVYVQVLKQLNGNKSERGVQLGFELLLRLCQKAPASSELAEFLRAFLREKIPELASSDVLGVAKACLMQLDDPNADDDQQMSSLRSRFHSSAGDEPRSRVYSSQLDEQTKPKRGSVSRASISSRRGSRRLSLDLMSPAQEDPEAALLVNMATQVSERLDGAAGRIYAEVTRLSNESEGRAAEIERLTAEKAQEAATIAALASRAVHAAGQLDVAAGHVTGEVAQLSARAFTAASRLDQAAAGMATEVGGLSSRAAGLAERLEAAIGGLTSRTAGAADRAAGIADRLEAAIGGLTSRTAGVAERLEVASARLEGEVSRLKAENQQQAAEIERLKALLAQQGSS